MSKKLNAVIPDETWEALEKIAAREIRTKSQMAAMLLADAIAEYWRRNPETETEPAPEPAPTQPKTPPATKAKRGNKRGN